MSSTENTSENALENDGHADQGPGAETPTPKLCAEMVRARELQGLTQKEVGDKLHLTPTYIRYMDTGQFQKFPNPAFIKGYLRSYARVVDLSGDDVVAMYEAEFQTQETPTRRYTTAAGRMYEAEFQTQTTPQVSAEKRGMTDQGISTASPTGPVLSIGLAGLAGLVIVIGLIWWLLMDARGPTPAVTGLSPVKIERRQDGQTRVITLDAGGADKIDFRFSGDSWVEITEARHGRVYDDMIRENDRLIVYGTPPFDVLLDEAIGVEITYNGRPFNLARYIRQDRTASLTIPD